jgi:hypothetical protein
VRDATAIDAVAPHASNRTIWIALAALVLAGLIPLVWPGDVPFINDEPQLIAKAVSANRSGRLAPMGLLGTYGFVYGPAPTWVYQALLAVSNDLVVVAALHIVLMSAVTAGALWWLARSLRLWVWFAPIPLLSPYYWFYARALWDNPFLLPLGALAMAGYAAHLESGSRRGLRVSVAAMLAIPLVHLMGVSLIVPLALHMLVVRHRTLWNERYSLAGIAAVALALAWPYWRYLAGPRPPAPNPGGVLDGWLFPLFGARSLGAGGLDYFYGAGAVASDLFRLVGAVSLLAYVLAWGGILVAVALVVRAVRTRSWTAKTHIAAIAVAALLCQSVIDGISGKFQHPHYQNGTWIACVLLAWLAVDHLANGRRAARWTATAATGVLASALLLAVGALALTLHRSHGTRDVYGPTLANQQQVVRALAHYASTSDVDVQVNMWQQFPRTLAILRQLNAARQVGLPRATVQLRYASGDPASGAIEMAVY